MLKDAHCEVKYETKAIAWRIDSKSDHTKNANQR
jgi:hypothetical protein